MIAVGAKALPRLIILLALTAPLVVPGNQVPAEVSAAAVPSSGSHATVRQAAAVPGMRLAEARLVSEAVAEVPAKRISKRLDAFLRGRPGPVTAMVKELGTGRVYRYHAGERLITASTAKVQILMALLLRTPWKRLPAAVRRDAESMIRSSDNHAADRLWVRIGGAEGFSAAGKRFGLKDTAGVPGSCVDLYCWGITKTSVDDQVRLMEALVSRKSPLKAAERRQVLRLMGAVVDGQDWGISAAACRGERVALKNGWLKRVSTKRWATVSVGLIRGGGRDYAVAVLTEGSPEVGYGIATVEGVAERIMRGFRRCQA
ncbi:secreted protein [[Actinomadura] parvosata subsp. kistnae]|uniref:serine hydrolase n=1 Tax=[Actinomadura] parvosata TaxID=1955412 RepID=UPI000D262A99|nr:serine hydrolase [Nonomuraea sp. ATCC 55076]SPL92527.1 secreted protein [Actinomadura parvosata subsp. kistnae]